MSWHFAMFQFSNTSLYTHIPNSYFLQISIKRFNFWPETSHKIIKNVTFIKLTNTISIMQSTMTYHTFLINKNHMHYKHFSVHKNKVFAFLKDSNDHWVVSLSAGFFGLGLVLDVEVVGVGRFDVVLRREIGVRVIESVNLDMINIKYRIYALIGALVWTVSHSSNQHVAQSKWNTNSRFVLLQTWFRNGTRSLTGCASRRGGRGFGGS